MQASKRAKKKAPAKKKPAQAGERRQPTNPMPAQHLAKPGHEHALPLFQAEGLPYFYSSPLSERTAEPEDNSRRWGNYGKRCGGNQSLLGKHQ